MTLSESAIHDVRYAVRSLRRNPAFTVTALLILTLGIGANTAIFTIVNGVLLRPLAYSKPAQLMYVSADAPALATAAGPLSVPEYLEFRQMTHTFATVGAYRQVGGVYTTGEVNITAGDRPLRARSLSVDTHLLEALDLRAVHGRLFTEAETDLSADRGLESPQAMFSYEFWRSAFGGQEIVGKTVRIGGRPFEIVGIMQPGADVMDNRIDVWLPLGLPRGITQSRTLHIVNVIGRLKEGVTPEAARTELDAFLSNWGQRTGARLHVPVLRPSNVLQHRLRLDPLQEAVVGGTRRAIWLLQIAVGLVLLVACTNLANLVLARAEARRREFAVRAALGAGRGRLLRHSITEGLLLSAAGGALGVGLAHLLVKGLVWSYPTVVPRATELTIDVPVLLFALATSFATGILLGVAPATQGRALDVATMVRGVDTAGDGGRQHVRRGLVVAQFALTVMLVTGAVLLIRTVYNLTQVDAGFDRTHLVTFQVTLPEPYDPDTRALAYQRLLDKLRSIPAVQSASIASGLPLRRSAEAVPTGFEGHTSADGSSTEVVDYYQLVIGDYFQTLGIPIVAGRGFLPEDNAANRRVAVVNETLARRVFNGLDPIGRQLRPNLGQTLGYPSNTELFTVVGVVKDVKQGGVDTPVGTELYVPLEPLVFAAPTMNVLLRTTATATALAEPLTRLVREVDPNVPIVRLRGLDEVFTESVGRPRLLAELLGAFAGLALLLAAVGTYGVLSYFVTGRRREIGVRMALGANRARVMTFVMSHGLILTVIGVGIGLAAALVASRMMAALLFQAEPTDPVTAATVIGTMLLVAVIACGLPAWRASRVDPNVVLRTD
jgi:putative ABC transport system permease protein